MFMYLRGLATLLFITAILGVNSSLNTNVEYVGRFDYSTGAARAAWPGTGIRMNLLTEKDTVTITVNYNNCGTCNYYVEADVNCIAYKKFQISSATPSITLTLDSAVGNSLEVSFIKVTESSNGNAAGIMEIGDIVVDGASFISKTDFTAHYKSSCLRPYQMLVIGDSITAAYGSEGSMPCTFSASTENSNIGYAVDIARAVGAEIHLVPWSGKGVVRNYGDANQMSAEPMPTFYNRTIATLPIGADNYWDPSNYQPDVVLVTLGTNDYSTDPVPSDDQFISGLVNLLTLIKTDYPGAQVAAMCAPMRRGSQCTNIKTAANTANVHYVDIDTDTLKGGYGCDGHPNIASQQNIADYVLGSVQRMLKMKQV